MINSNLALIFVNIACIIIFLTTKYNKKVKYYDTSLELLEKEQGDWYVNSVLEKELTRMLTHYNRNADDFNAASDSDSSDDSQKNTNVKRRMQKKRVINKNVNILQPVKLDLRQFISTYAK